MSEMAGESLSHPLSLAGSAGRLWNTDRTGLASSIGVGTGKLFITPIPGYSPFCAS